MGRSSTAVVAIATLVALGLAAFASPPLAGASMGAQRRQAPPRPSKRIRYFRYRAIYKGSGSYAYDLDSTGPFGSVHVSSDFRWNVGYGKVLVPKGPVAGKFDIGRIVRKGSEASGDWAISEQGSLDGDCSRSGKLKLGGDDDIGGALEGDRNKRGLSLVAGPGWLRTGVAPAADICDGHNFWQAWLIAASGAGQTPDGNQYNDPLAVPVKIARSKLGDRRIAHKVSDADQRALYEPFQTDCGSNDTDICVQHFAFSGRLSLIRLRRH
jgi:hypothetical protein